MCEQVHYPGITSCGCPYIKHRDPSKHWKECHYRLNSERDNPPSQAPEPVQGEAVDGRMLSAESKTHEYEIERAVERPDELGRPPQQFDSVFAWAYTYGGERRLAYPSMESDQVRLGLYLGKGGDAGPSPAYTDWKPLYTAAAKPDAELVALLRSAQWCMQCSPSCQAGIVAKCGCKKCVHARIDAKLAELQK